MRIIALGWALCFTILICFGAKESWGFDDKFWWLMFTIVIPMLLGYGAGRESRGNINGN